MHLDESCARFTMIVKAGEIAGLRVEKDPMDLTCTTVDVILDDIGPS